jgi:hypothetical protein
VPVTTTVSVTAANARPSRCTRDDTNWKPRSCASTATTIAAPKTAIASRKWAMTATGSRSRRTVSSPSGACASVPSAASHATSRAHGARPRRKCEEIAVASESRIGKTLTTRFPNSTNEW